MLEFICTNSDSLTNNFLWISSLFRRFSKIICLPLTFCSRLDAFFSEFIFSFLRKPVSKRRWFLRLVVYLRLVLFICVEVCLGFGIFQTSRICWFRDFEMTMSNFGCMYCFHLMGRHIVWWNVVVVYSSIVLVEPLLDRRSVCLTVWLSRIEDRGCYSQCWCSQLLCLVLCSMVCVCVGVFLVPVVVLALVRLVCLLSFLFGM